MTQAPRLLRISIHGGAGAGKTTFIDGITKNVKSKDGGRNFLHRSFLEDTDAISNNSQEFGTNTFFHPLVLVEPVWNLFRRTIPITLLSIFAGSFLQNRGKFSPTSFSSLFLLCGAVFSYGIAYFGRYLNCKVVSAMWIFNIKNHLQSMKIEEESSLSSQDPSTQVIHWFDRTLVDCWAFNREAIVTSMNSKLIERLVQQSKTIDCSVILDTDMKVVWKNLENRSVHSSDPGIRFFTRWVLLKFKNLVLTSHRSGKATKIWHDAWGIPVICVSQLNLKKNETGNTIWDEHSYEILWNAIEEAVSEPKNGKSEEVKALIEEMEFSTIGHKW